ncbi:hypothetical protein WDU94_009644, partial [Cyamophila willieti]
MKKAQSLTIHEPSMHVKFHHPTINRSSDILYTHTHTHTHTYTHTHTHTHIRTDHALKITFLE